MDTFLKGFSEMQTPAELSKNLLFRKNRRCGAFTELTKLEVQSIFGEKEINF